jgi:hypothetical protein
VIIRSEADTRTLQRPTDIPAPAQGRRQKNLVDLRRDEGLLYESVSEDHQDVFIEIKPMPAYH